MFVHKAAAKRNGYPARSLRVLARLSGSGVPNRRLLTVKAQSSRNNTQAAVSAGAAQTSRESSLDGAGTLRRIGLTPIFNKASTNPGPAKQLLRLQLLRDPLLDWKRSAIASRFLPETVGHTIYGKIRGDEDARVTADRKGDDIHVQGLYRGSLPHRSAGLLLAHTLRTHGAVPKGKLIVPNVQEEGTLRAYEEGKPPAPTKLGKALTTASNELGLRIKSMTFGKELGKVTIEVDFFRD